MNINIILSVATVLILTACAATEITEPESSMPEYSTATNPYFSEISSVAKKVDRDRAAILAMRGDYYVDFNFMETVPLKAGYELHADKNTGGFETVIVVENTPGKVALQHILVSPGGHVIKHWRQDWTYEATERFEFVANQKWEIRRLDTGKTRGSWTQCVFEVSDAPRYCGTGSWNHRYGVSTWTSDRTWRPLPRREYTKRNDYNAINAENRHTVTPNGWTHEQDNTKTVRDGQRTSETLVREFGFNDYRSIDGFDFSPAQAYWNRTSKYWARVRGAWDRRLQPGFRLTIATDVDGMPIIEGTFTLAERTAELSETEQLDSIEALLDMWTENRQLVSCSSDSQGDPHCNEYRHDGQM